MVYCGKASQNCQNCRTRRIKCDKLRPQCTQCVRVGKPCPGYRDQLSLMFRDESTKVIQKAHAKWGVQDSSSDSGVASGSSLTSESPSDSSSHRRTSATDSITSNSPVSLAVAIRVPKEIPGTTFDRAIQFYLEHYVIGLPDEAKVGQDLQRERWVFAPTTRQVMAAVGYAGLANISGDKGTMLVARQQYGVALRYTALSLQDPQGIDIDIAIRAVVLLGMFEVVRGDDQPTKGAQSHIMGGAALMRTLLPVFQSSPEGLRALMQLCYSMVATVMCSVQQLSSEPNVMIPTEPVPDMAQGVLPPAFFDWVNLGSSMAPTPDVPGAELLGILTRFVQLSASVRSQQLKDKDPETARVLREALDIEAQLDSWERHLDGMWLFTEEHKRGGFFPPDAVFEGYYHVYTDMWTARVWTNYRFARILVSQLLLEGVERFPVTGQPLISATQQRQSLEVIKRVARDTFVSVSTHYRHPRLARAQREVLEKTQGGAGIGVAQVPTLLFQIKVASAAPGVPHHYYTWGLAMMRTIFADTGMLQAKRLADILEKLKEASPRVKPVCEDRGVLGEPPAST